MLVSAGVLWLISRLYAMRMLDRDYQTEKMFVNNASHEINNPLTAIQGECEVGLLRDYSAQEYQDILRRIAHEAERVVTIMRELLQFSHVRSGEKMTELEPVNIASLLQSLTEGRCELDCKSDFTVSADAHLLRMAFHNLINNAIKYSDGKPVAITVSDHLVMICDQGIGIPKDDLPHIFEPFYRASNTGSVMGHGVGLALAKAILEKHEAKVSVESQQGEGTTVCVAFR